MNVRYLLILGAVGFAFWGFRQWRRGVQAAMVLLVLEGAIRKWLFPGAQDLVYFAKDVLLLGVYAGFLQAPPTVRGRSPEKPQLMAALTFSAVVGLAQVFNPELPNLLVGVLGFKAYFLYVPLIWVLPAAFRDDRELARFLKRYVVLTIPVGLLACAQFFSPATSPLNTYARSSGATGYVATFGSSPQARVTATFSYITGYSSYVFTIMVLLLAILAATRWRLRDNWGIYGSLSMTVLGMLMTGSRGPVLMLALLLPLYWWLGVLREPGSVAIAGRILLGFSLLAALLNYVGADAIQAFYGRAAESKDLWSRIASPVLQPLNLLPEAGLLGFGIGATHQTAVAVTQHLRPYSWLRGLLVEGEPGQVMLELGLLGFLSIYFVRVYLIVFALRQVFTLRTPFHRAVATSCVLFFLAHLPGGVVFNVTADLYYWFFAGLLFLVMRLDLELVSARAPVTAPVPVARKPLPAPRAARSPAASAPEANHWPPAPR